MRLSELPEIDKSLRPYQVKGKKSIYDAWDTSRTVLFQMPTGTGKTRLFSSIIRDTQRLTTIEKKRHGVLVLAHRTELIQQIDETLSHKYGIAHGIIKSGYEEDNRFPVQVASVQTIVRRLDKWREKGFSFIIIDEAHHAVSSTYMKICAAFPDAKILGVTATPCRLSGDALRKLFGILVLTQPISKFIEEGYLSPYNYFSIRPESSMQAALDGISKFNIDGDYAESEMMRICDTNKVRANIIQSYIKHAKGKKGIIYTINQEHNKHICDEYTKIGVRIKAIDSKTPSEERKRTVAAFRAGTIDIICNVNIFSEGFDCPDCEFIQLARPTCSLSMYLQQVGRGLRPHPNKTNAIILDNVGSYNKFGLPSANRKWRHHFEGVGQRVTKASNNTSVIGGRSRKPIKEGDEDMILIFSGNSFKNDNDDSSNLALLESIISSHKLFPLGGLSIVGTYESDNWKEVITLFSEVRGFQSEDEWTDEIYNNIENARIDTSNNSDELDWVENKIARIRIFSYNGKFGICELKTSPKNLVSAYDMCKAGKMKTDEVFSILLQPIYDEIQIPDSLDRAICKKDGKYGVISGESFVPVVPFEYERLEMQSDGMYLAEKNNQIGLIDGDKIIIPFNYDEILACVISPGERYYAIYENGHYALKLFNGKKEINDEPILHKVIHLHEDIYMGLSENRHGFICNSKGEVLLPFNFERVGLNCIKDKFEILLGVGSSVCVLQKDLEITEVIENVSASEKKFIERFSLDKFWTIKNNKIVQKHNTLSVNEVKPLNAEEDRSNSIEEIPSITTEIEDILNDIDTATSDNRPAVKSLPEGFCKGENGLIGYSINGEWFIEPELEDIEVIKQGRILVTKNGRKGVYVKKDGKPSLLIPILFKSLSIGKKNKYRTELGSQTYKEDFLSNALYNTGQYLVVKGQDCEEVYFLDKLIATFKHVVHLKETIFIVQHRTGKYGLIKFDSFRIHTIRAMEYYKIELASDGDSILLYKNEHNRPRYIALHSLLNK